MLHCWNLNLTKLVQRCQNAVWKKSAEGDERRGKCSNNIKVFSPALLKYFFILKHKLFALTFLFTWHKQFWKWKKTPKQYKVPMKLNTDQNNFLCYSTVWSLSLENFETSGFVPLWNKTCSEITKCFVKKNANPLTELLFANAGGPASKASLGPTFLLCQLDKPTRNMRRITSFISLLSAMEGEGKT